MGVLVSRRESLWESLWNFCGNPCGSPCPIPEEVPVEYPGNLPGHFIMYISETLNNLAGGGPPWRKKDGDKDNNNPKE